MTRDRELGLEFGDLRERLDARDYPASQDELLEAVGDSEIEMEGETVTLEELLEPLNEEEYHSVDEVEQAVLNMVGEEAIGRKYYSDRTPPAPGEDRWDERPPGREGTHGEESF